MGGRSLVGRRFRSNTVASDSGTSAGRRPRMTTEFGEHRPRLANLAPSRSGSFNSQVTSDQRWSRSALWRESLRAAHVRPPFTPHAMREIPMTRIAKRVQRRPDAGVRRLELSALAWVNQFSGTWRFAMQAGFGQHRASPNCPKVGRCLLDFGEAQPDMAESRSYGSPQVGPNPVEMSSNINPPGGCWQGSPLAMSSSARSGRRWRRRPTTPPQPRPEWAKRRPRERSRLQRRWQLSVWSRPPRSSRPPLPPRRPPREKCWRRPRKVDEMTEAVQGARSPRDVTRPTHPRWRRRRN